MKELQAASNAASRAETALPDGGVLSSPFGEIDLSKHRDEAQQIWTMLDEMSDKDPEVRHGEMEVIRHCFLRVH